MSETHALLDSMIAAACEAGLNSMNVLAGSFRVEHKDDRSPVTRADTEADTIIATRLEHCSLPLVSEESALPGHKRRMSWSRYLLVDPLDGTKGFVERGQEFSVNIALMQDNTPVLGVIALPIPGTVYFGGPETPTTRIDEGFEAVLAHPDSVSERGRPIGAGGTAEAEGDEVVRVIASRHSLDDETRRWIAGLKTRLDRQHAEDDTRIETVQAGSAAKFCVLSENEADVYPRFAPCMEWDTAAGVALLRGAGGAVFDAYLGSPLAYGNPDWYSRPFIAFSKSGRSRLPVFTPAGDTRQWFY